MNLPADIADAVRPIPVAEANAARRAAAEGGRRFPEALQERLGCDDGAFAARLAATFRLPQVALADLLNGTPDFQRLPFGEAMRRECVLLDLPESGATLVLADPYDAALRDWAELRLGGAFRYAVAHRLDVVAYLARQEESLRASDAAAQPQAEAAGRAEGAEELSLVSISDEDSPVVRLVNSTLYDALRAGASDVHWEMHGTGLVIKYRIDGVLSQAGSVAGMATAEQAISRIKVMAELDIAERRVPQDGRFKAVSRGREIDFRVSVMPSIFGEDAVVRILDKQSLIEEAKSLRLDHLGFEPGAIRQLRRLALQPHGMMLATGPTGSGKTTTLYALISEINTGAEKIVTIEDPVEYQLPGVLQIPVNDKKGLTFARGLRSILRHDPDRIMVGEIRDPETAEIAVQSALTGHLVFTTVHANNVFDVLGRFLHMGVSTYSFAAALKSVLAQRLVRVNCPQCREPYVPEAEELADSGISPAEAAGYRFTRGRGCGHCRGSGFRGRRAVAELLVVNDTIRDLIASQAPVAVLKEAAHKGGTRFLREAALDVVRSGETTLEEANRVTGTEAA
jgi:general secretion pathway protein E